MLDVGTWTVREWQKDRRYYLAELRQDLFGDWQLVRLWGSLGTRRGRMQHIGVPDYAAGLALLEATHKRRCARGYREAGA